MKNTFTYRPENREFLATIEFNSMTEMDRMVCLCNDEGEVTAFSEDKNFNSQIDNHPKVEVPIEVLLTFFEFLEETYSGK